jgi:ketosteroid isomerase-like protein
MKKSALCFVGLLLLTIAVWPQNKSSAATESAVAALEQQWLKAQQTSNPDLIEPLLADRFIETTSDGKMMSKAEALAGTKAAKYASAQYTDVKVSVFGNTAIATGEFKGKGTDENGKPIASPERWTDTWVKMPNGKWQCVASHASLVRM